MFATHITIVLCTLIGSLAIFGSSSGDSNWTDMWNSCRLMVESHHRSKIEMEKIKLKMLEPAP